VRPSPEQLPAALSATSYSCMGAPPSPLSSRAKPRDLQCALPPNNCLRLFQLLATVAWERHPPFVIRAKPRDLQCALPPNNRLQLSRPQVTITWKRYAPLCHPERSRGTCGSPQPFAEACAKNPALSSMAIISSRLAPSLYRASSKSSARTGYLL